MEKTESHLYDAPISDASEDRLTREPFAHLIAKALLSNGPSGASVIGLVAPYGTGKSSVAKMVEGIIRDQASIVRFEPWMIGTREALAEEFFVALGRAVVPADGAEISESTRKTFYRYGSKVLKAVSIGASALGAIVPGSEVAGKAANSAADAMELAAAGLEARAGQPTLAEARQQLIEDLADLNRTVVVIVDDVDRLTRDELRTLLQLIKACADLPNVRYLLLYDRDQLLHALEGFVNDSAAFLEKIINQPFDLPEATTSQRADLLDGYLKRLDLHNDLSKHARERLDMTFDRLLLPGLVTVRRVKRFVLTVSSLLPGVVRDGFRNIDPADFLALEYLRQNAPSVYHVLRDEEAPNPGGLVARMVSHKEWPQRVAERRKKAIDALPEDTQELAKVAIEILEERSDSYPVTDRRFNTHLWKPVYFGFDEGRAGVSESKWRSFISHLGEPDGPQPWLLEWADPKKRSDWTASIAARTLDIPWRESETLLAQLLAWGDAQGPEPAEVSAGYSEAIDSVCTCVSAILKTAPDEVDPVLTMKEAISKSGSLITAGFCLGWELGQLERNRYEAWSTGHDLKRLVGLMRGRFRRLLALQDIWDCKNVGAARSTLYYLLGEKEHAKWWASVAANPESVIKYIELDLAHKDLSRTVIDDGPMLEAIRNVDPAMLTEKGEKARQDILRASRISYPRRKLRRRPEDAE